MRQPYIAGNWKMHKTLGEARELAKELVDSLGSCRNKVMIAPPFTALSAVAQVLSGSRIRLGAQNMASAESGAHTGEVSVLMLADIGVQTVIIGHSERRLIYGESDKLIKAKVSLALQHGMEVVLCVGETLDQREADQAERVVETQLRQDLAELTESALSSVVIAYEPVWAIGTGRNASPADADAMHAHIRSVLREMFSPAVAESMIIQYGGSVKPENAESLLSMPHVDGALVGGASLAAESFASIAGFKVNK